MKLSYDPKGNFAYISLQALKEEKVDTIEIGNEMYVDMAPDGTIYGIGLLKAKRQLGALHKKELIVENLVTKKTSKLKLPM